MNTGCGIIAEVADEERKHDQVTSDVERSASADLSFGIILYKEAANASASPPIHRACTTRFGAQLSAEQIVDITSIHVMLIVLHEGGDRN